jgi:hypothetical protein
VKSAACAGTAVNPRAAAMMATQNVSLRSMIGVSLPVVRSRQACADHASVAIQATSFRTDRRAPITPAPYAIGADSIDGIGAKHQPT